MSVMYRLIEDEEFKGAITILDGETHTVQKDHPAWMNIVEELAEYALYSGEWTAEELAEFEAELLAQIAPAQGISDALQKLSERVSYKDGRILFDGDELDNALTEHIIRLLGEGKDAKRDGYPAFVNFLEKLYTNPSKKSRKHLFHFIQANRITVHPDGDFIAYKGTQRDGKSIHAGYGIVDGEEFEHDYLPNYEGAVVEIPRSRVDNNRDVACSTGLHAGAFSYANDFARGKLFVVKINPRDVVSVPSDSEDRKLRVSRYVVLQAAEGEYTLPTWAGANIPEVVAEEVDEEELGDGEWVEVPVKMWKSADAEPTLAPITGVVQPVAAPEGVTVDTYNDAEVPEDSSEFVVVATPEAKPSVEEKTLLHEGPDGEPVLGEPGVNFRAPEAEVEQSDEERDFQERVDAMKLVIPTLVRDNVNLQRHRSKRITAKNRKPFDEARKQLGL